MRIGYARALDGDDRKEQERLFEDAACDAVFWEPHMSPKRREQLNQLLESLQEGDEVIVWKLHILADSTRHLMELLDLFEEKGAVLRAVADNISTTSSERFSLSEVVRVIADFQRDAISNQTKAGLSEAKEKGMQAGRPRKPDANVKKAIELYKSKQHSLAEIKEQTGISKSTLYRYLEN